MNNDEEIQKKMQGGAHPKDADELASERILKALSIDRSKLSPQFADRVIMHIKIRNERKSSIFDVLLAVIGGIAILAGLIVSLVLTNFKPEFGFLSDIGHFKGLFAFGVLLVILINILDKRLRRKKSFI